MRFLEAVIAQVTFMFISKFDPAVLGGETLI